MRGPEIGGVECIQNLTSCVLKCFFPLIETSGICIYLFIYKIFVQDGRFSIYIFTKYIKATAFQTSPVKKKRNKRLKFQIQPSNSKFQAEDIVNLRQKISK